MLMETKPKSVKSAAFTSGITQKFECVFLEYFKSVLSKAIAYVIFILFIIINKNKNLYC